MPGASQSAAIQRGSNHNTLGNDQSPPTYRIGLQTNNVTCNRRRHISVNHLMAGWRGVAPFGETGRAYHTERGVRLVPHGERFPSRTPDRTTSTSMPRPTLGQGSAPEDGGRRCRKQNIMTRSAQQRRGRVGHSGQRRSHPGSGRTEEQCRAPSQRGKGGRQSGRLH
jgi:hypothetical protein